MSASDWEIAGLHGLHIVDGDRPVATFHDRQDAAVAVACVKRVNGSSRTGLNGRRPEVALEDFPMIVREVVESGHPYYGVDLDEVLRDWALAVQNAQYAAQERIAMAERAAASVADDSARVRAIHAILRKAGTRKTLESQAVRSALISPDYWLS